MKIALAQMQPVKGDIDKNIYRHCHFVEKAIGNKADVIFFPELSLTGYEPKLAKELATTPVDKRLSIFQSLSDENNIVIGVSAPTKSMTGIHIGLIIFQPNRQSQVYSKQYLHDDELPYFIPGNEQLYIDVQHKKIALAICYESLLPQHAEMVSAESADIYLASVAKSANGVAKAYEHYPAIAKKYAMPVLMANCIGYCDNFQSTGSSAAWNSEGELVARLDDSSEGLLIYDTENAQAVVVIQVENT